MLKIQHVNDQRIVLDKGDKLFKETWNILTYIILHNITTLIIFLS